MPQQWKTDSADDPNTEISIAAVFESGSNLIARAADVIALEARRAVGSVATLAVITVVILLCVVATWALLCAAGAQALMNVGWEPAIALLAIAAANLLLAGILILIFKRIAIRLTFPYSRKMLSNKADSGAGLAVSPPAGSVG